jgi:hypothetical protein
VSTENKENHASEKKSSGQDKGEGTTDKVKGKRLPGLCPAIRARSLKDAQTEQRALPRRKGQG